MDQKLMQRSQQNWRHMLEWSSDSADLVEYETSQLLSMLLAQDRPLDTTAVHSVRLLGGLYDIVCTEADVYPKAQERVERSVGGLLEFLVRCFNTRETELLREVESSVVALLYNLAAVMPPSGVTHQQVAPFVPFLLHSAYVSLQEINQEGSQVHVFGVPPAKLADGQHLSRCDQYIWLANALCTLVDPAYFSALLGFSSGKGGGTGSGDSFASPPVPRRDASASATSPQRTGSIAIYGADERQMQLAFIYEHMQLTMFYLARSFEALYALPLHIASPAKRGSAEPKVDPHKVLSFLIDTDAPLIPPADYEDNISADDQDAALLWEYNPAVVESTAARLVYAYEVLNGFAPMDELITSDKPLAKPKPTQIVVLYVKLVVGCLNWMSVTLLAAMHSHAYIDDDSALMALWRCLAVSLVRTIQAFGRCAGTLPVDAAKLLTVQLFKGCLHFITVDQAFAAYHPQGSLSVTPVDWGGSMPSEIRRGTTPCGQPLLLLLSVAQAGAPYAALAGQSSAGMAAGARPPLEQCIATFLHDLFQTHLRVAQCCRMRHNAQLTRQSSRDHPLPGGGVGALPQGLGGNASTFLGAPPLSTGAASVPVQNIFRGLHEVLLGMTHSPYWHDLCGSRPRAGQRITDSLSPNWMKATEIAKGFAALPFGEQVAAEDVVAVSKNAFTLVHYFLQLSIPCAPTAPPTQISHTRPGRGWDDYEGYFQEMDPKPNAAIAFPPSFGLTDSPGDQGYRLKQLLSSHLRGILTVVPFFRILFIINRRETNFEQCAYYCSSLADLISYSAHNHGVAVPFLRTSLECYERCEAQQQALGTLEKVQKIFLSLMDIPSAALVQRYSTTLASGMRSPPRQVKAVAAAGMQRQQ